MTETQHKINFNKETTERLSLISIKMLQFIYSEVEKLDLSEREKIMAHYWVVKQYMDCIQEALDEMGIKVVEIQ